MLVATKYGEWHDEEGNELPSKYLRLLEKLGILKFNSKVVSHHRYIIYVLPDFDVDDVIETLKTIPKAHRVMDFEASGWRRVKKDIYGGFWAGNRSVNSITKNGLNIPYYYARNLRWFDGFSTDWIDVLDANRDFKEKYDTKEKPQELHDV